MPAMNNQDFFSRVYARVGRPVYVVRAYRQQVWTGHDEQHADRIVSDYARLGQAARKHKIRTGNER